MKRKEKKRKEKKERRRKIKRNGQVPFLIRDWMAVCTCVLFQYVTYSDCTMYLVMVQQVTTNK